MDLSEGRPTDYQAAREMGMDEVVILIETFNASAIRKKEIWEYEHPGTNT